MLKKIMRIAILSLISCLISLSAFNVWNSSNNQPNQVQTFEIASIKFDESLNEANLEQGKNEGYTRKLFECSDDYCIKCNGSPSICEECKTGYKIKNMKCEKKTPDLNSEELIIIMAAIFSPMFFIVICCIFCCIWYRKHKRETDRPSGSPESQVPLEMINTQNNHIISRFDNNYRSPSESFDSSESTGDREGPEKKALALLNGKILVNERTFEKVIQVYSKNENEIILDDGICSICLDNYDENREYRITPCGHIFHHDCIYSWLIIYKKKKCPNDNFKFK